MFMYLLFFFGGEGDVVGFDDCLIYIDSNLEKSFSQLNVKKMVHFIIIIVMIEHTTNRCKLLFSKMYIWL